MNDNGSVPSPASIAEVAAVRACEAVVRQGQGFPGTVTAGLLDVHAFAVGGDVSDLGSPAYWASVADLVEDGLAWGDWTQDEVDHLCCLFNTYCHRAHELGKAAAALVGSHADWGTGTDGPRGWR